MQLENAAHGVVLSGVADGHRSNEISALQSKKQLGLARIGIRMAWRLPAKLDGLEVSRKLDAKAGTDIV